jgi:curli biogenesis system outer membrane secretion channel CsgG
MGFSRPVRLQTTCHDFRLCVSVTPLLKPSTVFAHETPYPRQHHRPRGAHALALADVGTTLLKPSTATKTKDDTKGSQMGAYSGIRHALGVVDFETASGCDFDDGAKANMRAMLESALFATNRFVIVERGNLESVMNEQDLAASKRAAKSSNVAQTGKIRAARYIATALITEVSTNTSGDSGGVRIHGFSIGGSSAKSAIVLVVKLVDTTSSEVVASERIRGEAGKAGLNLGYEGHGWGGELGTFAKTPIGEAAQDCINQAVKFIASKMESYPSRATWSPSPRPASASTSARTTASRPARPSPSAARARPSPTPRPARSSAPAKARPSA